MRGLLIFSTLIWLGSVSQARIDRFYVCGQVTSFDKSTGIAEVDGKKIKIDAKFYEKRSLTIGENCVAGSSDISESSEIALTAGEKRYIQSLSAQELSDKIRQFSENSK